MRIAKYQAGDTALLKSFAHRLCTYHSLRYPAFVDYYYARSPWCELLTLTGDSGEVAGVLGVERMEFAAGDRRMTLGFGSNFAAFESGAGGLLFLHWLKSCDFGLVFGGSPDTHRILRQQNWTWYPSIRVLRINRTYELRPDAAWWKRFAGAILRSILPGTDLAERIRRARADGAPGVAVTEQQRFSPEMLPKQTAFAFRFAPGVEYLNWRYNTELPLVRYRVFRIDTGSDTGNGPGGYVVVNQQPRRLVIAQCDGEDPLVLTQGILAALETICREDRVRREVFLTSSHAEMLDAFRSLGFRDGKREYPFAVGSLRHAPAMPQDTGKWLVSFDWGDNGLRAPFPGQVAL